MHFSKRFVAGAATLLALGLCGSVARAQEPASQAPEQTPAPLQTSQPTLLDQQYDGKTHVMVAPYIWAPSVQANFQFPIPTLPHHGAGGKLIQGTFNVGPSDYLPKLNAAAMAAFDIRKGNVDLYGDAIYLNASTTATISSTITGPLGKIRVPVTIDSSARLSSAIWEFALGFTVARSHNADLSTFLGYRNFPVFLNVSYNATVGKRGLLAPSGTTAPSARTTDAIWGIRGRAFTDKHWYVPYYFDYGGGNDNQTWQAYGGAGYAFSHGQSLVVLYRQLNYFGFPSNAIVQKMDFGGPVLGYTLNL